MRKHRILLADDTDDIRVAFQEGLEATGLKWYPPHRERSAETYFY